MQQTAMEFKDDGVDLYLLKKEYVHGMLNL